MQSFPLRICHAQPRNTVTYLIKASTYCWGYTRANLLILAGDTDKPGIIPAYKASAVYGENGCCKTGLSLGTADLDLSLQRL